jgi:DNA-binding response OmpR family regulator
VHLPDGDGRDFCQRLRRTGVNVPVLILTDAARESDVVRGLDSGANDYIIRPVGTAELIARLRAQLRAFESSEHAEIVIGPYVFRPGAKLLQQGGGRPIRLTEKEAAVLKYLYRADGVPVSREALLQDVWGYNADATTHTVETHIYRLRRKIGQVADGQRLVVNDGGGYRLSLGRPRAAAPPRRAIPELAFLAMAS